ncbi:hypothetical protein QR685DRAFT_423429, partial [Neurospora intermedia]
FAKWYDQAASTCSPAGDRHVWLVSPMRVPLYDMTLSLAVVVGKQGAGKTKSARLLPKGLGTAGTTALQRERDIGNFGSTASAFSIASNFLPKATPRRMNLFSIEVVSVVLDFGD